MTYVIADTLGRTPVQTEIDGIMEQVNLFYSDVLLNAFPDFESFVATETNTDNSIAGSVTITMLMYSGLTTFAMGSAIPSQAEVEAAIAAADLDMFRADYIPMATPVGGNIFANSQTVTHLAV